MIPHKPLKVDKKLLENLHTALYNRGQQLFNKYSPCQIKPTGEFEGSNKLMVCSKPTIYQSGYCCCGGCKNLGNDGCKVEALWCKLWFCVFLPGRYSEMCKKLRGLARIMEAFHLSCYRAGKEDAINKALELI